MSIDKMAALVATYKENAAMLSALEQEQEDIRKALKAELAERGVDRMDINGHKVALSTYTSSRIDSKALKATGLPNLQDGIKKYSAVKQNSLRIACFPFVDINGVKQYEKLTRAVDEIVRQLRTEAK